ncbi:hypothetical protein C1N80_06180 [Brachybacterium sp. SGAir0954]|uniref:hypothetical protein n=1 Tax=Brachybacterium sp. SGAir0954 TaxID=2571029 RepID=UPI0010CCC263|nr:hypothetical protein [Brachybacterium sp. SGAir0954]QCR53208.1 hypothetical protein C1N80_06180 [Brachybacterium sp. SGAir0954]
MRYVRVRTEVGHEISTPENDPFIESGRFKLVGRKKPTSIPLPPKFKKTLPPAGGDTPDEEA